MNKKKTFLIEIGLGVVLTAFISWAYLTRWYTTESFSLKTYDILSRFQESSPDVSAVEIVGIDDESLGNLGRWPWPRPIVAQLIDEVAYYGAKVIGLNIFYIDADQNQGLEEISLIEEEYKNLLTNHKRIFRNKRIPIQPFNDFLAKIEESKYNLDGDAILATSIEEAGTVVLPMAFSPGEPLGDNLGEILDIFAMESLNLSSEGTFPDVPPAQATALPLQQFMAGALAIGHSNLSPDVDGTIRRLAPVMRYGQDFFPSFGIQMVREYLDLQREAFAWDPDIGFILKKAQVPLDEESLVYLKFAGPAGTFKHQSAIDVLTGALQDNAFENKIVLVGVTATGASQTYVIPGGDRLTGMEIWANHLENVMNQRFIRRPSWASYAEWGMIALAGLIIIGLLPFVRARLAVPIWALVFLGMAGASFFLFTSKGMWVSPTYGMVLALLGYAAVMGRRLMFTEKGKELVEAEGVETNKMLGLSFQGQGMLDLAFEKFGKCPVDDQMKNLLYNLGLDMERKRMYTKAAAVYERIRATDPKYKDIQQKIEMLKKAGEGAVFGGVGKKSSDQTVVVEGLGMNTTLGRYEVVKELGRGAMGIVYLGKDPKINRQVAIKTLQFEDDISDDQMKSIKERFFREAESAGNLTHPNIIRIFDAGEDQDVAYIAMELLDGKDLKSRCEKDNLLATERVLETVATVAEALDYAHQQGVVHRDIKPANIMVQKDDTLRITDFGIARIQASSKTATGAVLGTPAYMSPEQVNGQKVDGRSDIFSLGVTLFEMLTGEKPFQADSIAALLYRIANVEHPDPREFNPNLPEAVIPIINKALAKEVAKRYQRAGEMAQDLKAAIESVKAGPSGGHGAPAQPAPKKEPSKPAGKKPEPKPITETPAAAEPPPAPEPIKIVEPPPKKGEKPAEPKPPAPQQKAPAPVSEPPPTPQPQDTEEDKTQIQNEFFSELQEAFNIPGSENQPKESPENKSEMPEPPAAAAQAEPIGPSGTPEGSEEDKTVVLPPEERPGWEPGKTTDIPFSPQIEHNFSPEEDKPNDAAQGGGLL
jgi:serine/threonine-protein kinase